MKQNTKAVKAHHLSAGYNPANRQLFFYRSAHQDNLNEQVID